MRKVMPKGKSSRLRPARCLALLLAASLVTIVAPVRAQESAWPQKESWPPKLPGGLEVVTDTSEDFLKPSPTIKSDVEIAKTAPTVDFMYYPMQNKDDFWSNWGDGVAVNGKYYSSYGNHKGIGGESFVCEYDTKTRKQRCLVDVTKFLNVPEGHYTPGKIHGRLDMGADGWVYFATARGGTRVTTDKNHFKGDWVIRVHPGTGVVETVVWGPVPKDTILAAVTDPQRLIFCGGTAAGDYKDKRVRFFAYDIKAGKLLYSGYDGARRYMILSRSTGKLYYNGTPSGVFYRYDPATGGPPVKLEGKTIGIRAATRETPDGYVYTVSNGQKRPAPPIWRFNVKTEEIEKLDTAEVGTSTYITSIDAGPGGRYLYYVPGSHGGSEKDGSPVVQYDVKRRKKKVVAFLNPFYKDKYGFMPMGTFSTEVDPKGDKVYITWSGNRFGRRKGKMSFDTCALTVVHIPESERRP